LQLNDIPNCLSRDQNLWRPGSCLSCLRSFI